MNAAQPMRGQTARDTPGPSEPIRRRRDTGRASAPTGGRPGTDRPSEPPHRPDPARWVALGSTRVLVDPGVFPPQPDTLAVIDRCLALLADISEPVIADLCTGSGVIALALVEQHPDARIYAVDNSDAAVRSARANADLWARRTGTRIEVRAGDATDPRTLADAAGRADLVVANPPYLPDAVRAPDDLARRTSPTALYGGPDGLDVIRGVLDVATVTLRPGGWLVLEHAAGQQDSVLDLVDGADAYDAVTGHCDHASIPRFITARRRAPDAGPAAPDHSL